MKIVAFILKFSYFILYYICKLNKYNMANKIEYEFTWCDFLTPCPNGMDCMVGDYNCDTCQYCKRNQIITNVEGEDYKRYIDTGSGIVHCTFKNE